jgi:hypothetical protein
MHYLCIFFDIFYGHIRSDEKAAHVFFKLLPSSQIIYNFNFSDTFHFVMYVDIYLCLENNKRSVCVYIYMWGGGTPKQVIGDGWSSPNKNDLHKKFI